MLQFEQGSPEWLSFRKNKIGSSDAPIIVGESPWKTPYQLWQEKLGQTEEPVQTYAMIRGHMMEEKARSAYEILKGEVFFPMVVQHVEHSWQISSLDGISIDGRSAVEIKCPGKEDHALAVSGKIPCKYKAQLQHHLYVCGLSSIDYFSFNGEVGVIIEVKRDTDYLINLLKKEREFYYCLQTKTPPAFTEKDFIIKDDDLNYGEKARIWLEAKHTLNKAQEEEEKARQELIDASLGRNTRGFGIRIQKLLRKGPIVYEDIPELKSIDVEKYRKDAISYFKVIEEDNKNLPRSI